MKCTKCGKNNATVFITRNINGKITRECLCDECYKTADTRDIDKMMANMFSSHSRFFNDDIFELGNMFDSFMPSFRLLEAPFEGFEETRPERKELIKPTSFRIKKKENVEKKELTKEEKIAQLKEELNKKIQEEKYEDAAVIRDEIKKLEK